MINTVQRKDLLEYVGLFSDTGKCKVNESKIMQDDKYIKK